jgi:predicted transcriptional regulator
MARVGTDVRLFEVLSESERPMTSDELAQKTNVDPNLMSMSLPVPRDLYTQFA